MAKVNCLNIAGTVANKLLTMRNNTLSDSHLIIKRTCNGQLRSNAAGNLPGSNLPATLPGNALAACRLLLIDFCRPQAKIPTHP